MFKGLRKNLNAKRRQFKYKRNIAPSIELLKFIIEALEESKIDYYIDFGTLLGAVRDKAFIEWDDDIDISIIPSYNMDKINNLLNILERKKRYRVIKDYIEPSELKFLENKKLRVIKVAQNRVLELIFGGTMLDIFFKYENNDKIYWKAQDKIHTIPKEVIGDKFIYINFYNIKCKIPENYNEYLTYMYKNWEEPKENWQYYEQNTCR